MSNRRRRRRILDRRAAVASKWGSVRFRVMVVLGFLVLVVVIARIIR